MLAEVMHRIYDGNLYSSSSYFAKIKFYWLVKIFNAYLDENFVPYISILYTIFLFINIYVWQKLNYKE